MSRRRYRMGARAASLSRTRASIVGAAVRLHARQGIRATSWDDIADGAGVSRATVYRHFPTLETLVPACARLAFEAIDLPRPAEIERDFADLARPAERLERLVRETCACYERGAPWLRAAFSERGGVRSVRRTFAEIGRGVEILLDMVVGPKLPRERRITLRILLGFPFWQMLRDGGLGAGATADLIADLAELQLRERKESRQ